MSLEEDKTSDDDLVFKALASSTRRRMLDVLKESPCTTGALCAAFSELDRTTVLQHLRAEADLGREWSVGDVGRHAAIGGLGPTLVGSGEEIADALQSWVEETDVDGFNLAYAITPGTWEDVIEHVIPALRARGAYPDGYAEGTLREKLHGRGSRLPDEHRGASHRIRSSTGARGSASRRRRTRARCMRATGQAGPPSSR